jgi:SAM-dependent methyltransferase
MKQSKAQCCYLCNSQNVKRSSRQREINFNGSTYTFHICQNCGSYSLFPKLDQASVAKLYSKEYSDISSNLHQDESISYISKFVDLRSYILSDIDSKRSSYLDYGCGYNPVTLEIASSMGLDYQGVEFSSDVVAQANLAFPGKVITVEEFKKDTKKFDYIFIGDVIEHLSDPIAVLADLSNRLSSHGVLIAQGPLQGALTVTHMLASIKSKLLSSGATNFPPYHVSLASRKGMRDVLKVSNLELLNIKISEPQWPAPTLTFVLRRPSIRAVTLLSCKLLDQAISKMVPNFGSHYFLVAQKRPK